MCNVSNPYYECYEMKKKRMKCKMKCDFVIMCEQVKPTPTLIKRTTTKKQMQCLQFY